MYSQNEQAIKVVTNLPGPNLTGPNSPSENGMPGWGLVQQLQELLDGPHAELTALEVQGLALTPLIIPLENVPVLGELGLGELGLGEMDPSEPDLSEYDPHEVALDALEKTLVDLRDAFDREEDLPRADRLAGKILRHEAKIELLRDSWG